MDISLFNVVEQLPFKFSQGDSDVLKTLMLKNDNEFLRFKGKDQFDKRVKSIYPHIRIEDLYLDYLYVSRKSDTILRLCQWYEEHGDKLTIKFEYHGSIDDYGNQIGTKFKTLQGVTRPVKDPFWNKYLPPNFANDACSFSQTYISEITPIPNYLPNSSFECNLDKLFLSQISPKKHEKSSYNDTVKILSSWGINLDDLFFDSFKEQ